MRQKNTNRNIRKAVSVLLAAICILTLLPVSALAADSGSANDGVLRIGLSEYPRYGYTDENGQAAGADVEYAYKIAEYADLRVEIVLIKDAETYFKSLDDGSVDMLFDALKTDERQEKYLYSEHESGSTPMSVYVKNDDDRFVYGNTDQLDGLVVGSEKDSYVTDVFKNWCDSHNVSVHIVEYKDNEEINAAIDSGQVDAGVYGTEEVEGYRTILQFSPTPYYIIFRKEDQELKNKIDEAMDNILAEDPLCKDKLLQKYSSSSGYLMDAYSNEEENYISANPTVDVAVLKDDEPYFSLSSDGTPCGIIPDYYDKLSSLTGLKFNYSVYDTQSDAVDAVLDGDADIIGMYSDGLIQAYNSGLRLTNAYATVNSVLITKSGTETGEVNSIAVKQRSMATIGGGLDGDLSSAALYGYNNASECFEAMKKGDTDAMICGLPSATWLINQTYSNSYSITPLPTLNLELCGAVDYDSGCLCSILNKAISASGNSFNSIAADNTMPATDLRTFVTRIPAYGIIAFAIIMIMAVLALVFALVSIGKRQREKAAVAAAKAENDRREVQLAAMERGNEERNEFFSSISHDMRTPLNAIIGFSDLAAKKADSPELKDYLVKIQASGKLLLDLISDTLAMSKINSGKLKLSFGPVDITEMADSFVVPIRAEAESKHISFTVTNTARPRVVMTDRLNVEKIMLNLLSNAVKYTDEGGHVEFGISDEQAGGKDWTVFRVKDDGVGISPDFLPHIYEPFVQENRYGEKSSGTGLGLSIVKNLVDLLGGKIDVESTPGSGTVFTVRFAFEDTSEAVSSGTDSVSPSSLASLDGKKILLCEDNDMNREIACALLKSKGITVVTAENGEEGLRLFSESGAGEFDAILMDIRMPVMNGYQAVRAIRALKRSDAARIPIIAMTADAFAEDVTKCLDAGMNAHIAKPLDPQRVFSVLAKYICKDSK